MAESTERTYIGFIWDAVREYWDRGENETFSFADVVECLRASELADRFDFERYDKENLGPQQGFHGPSLYSNGLKARRAADGIYHFSSFYETRMELLWFNRKARRGRRIPELLISGFYMKYRTIPHLLAVLRDVFPKIDAVQERIAAAEQETLRLKRVQDLVNVSIPDLLKETFRGSGFQYYFELGTDFLELNVKLPRRQKAQFKIKFDRLDKRLPLLLEELQVLRDVVKKYGPAKMCGYGDQVWIDPES